MGTKSRLDPQKLFWIYKKQLSCYGLNSNAAGRCWWFAKGLPRQANEAVSSLSSAIACHSPWLQVAGKVLGSQNAMEETLSQAPWWRCSRSLGQQYYLGWNLRYLTPSARCAMTQPRLRHEDLSLGSAPGKCSTVKGKDHPNRFQTSLKIIYFVHCSYDSYFNICRSSF